MLCFFYFLSFPSLGRGGDRGGRAPFAGWDGAHRTYLLIIYYVVYRSSTKCTKCTKCTYLLPSLQFHAVWAEIVLWGEPGKGRSVIPCHAMPWPPARPLLMAIARLEQNQLFFFFLFSPHSRYPPGIVPPSSPNQTKPNQTSPTATTATNHGNRILSRASKIETLPPSLSSSVSSSSVRRAGFFPSKP
ncbi:hypothetical protein LY76DRAFT_215195 [Colletotrichum caudatum]|nr:hypothetical protein LY76DRAFT_215195 [Colletotrichum caudatum]